MSYWQQQADKVHIGMKREEAEKMIPRQNYNELLWRLECMREVHAPQLPRFKEHREFYMVHAIGSHLMGYELSKDVFVVIEYDLSGRAPGPFKAGMNTINPGDRVIAAPIVTNEANCKRLMQLR